MANGWGRIEPLFSRCVGFTRWVPPPSPHPTAREHGPDVPACFFVRWPLAIQTAGSFGRAEPDGYMGPRVLLSRN